jgi:competence protein ComFC
LADFQNLFKLLKDCILPPFCTVCGKVSSCYVCESCKSFIRLIGENICLKCGQAYPVLSSDGGSGSQGIDKKTASGRICSLCKNENFYFYKSRSFAFYEGTAAELIKKYKYRKYYFLKDILAGFLKTAYKNYYNEEKIDFIETVPDIIQQRDFNSFGEMQEQSLNHMQTIAARLAVLLNTPYSGNITKIKKTSRQQLLDRSSRKLNPAGAFKVINRMQSQGKNYLVIDDVWTTGSTLNEVSIALKNAGADRVYLLTIARGA